MQEKNVVICVIKNKSKILLLRRNPGDDIYPGRWSFVTGKIETDETPLDTAFREIEEETGLSKDNLKLLKQSEEFTKIDKNLNTLYHNNAFLFETNTEKVELDHENVEYYWIYPKEVLKYHLVPGMIQTALMLMDDLVIERPGVLVIVYKNLDSFAIVKTRNDNIVLPTGGIEEGETEEDAVIHEVREETGIDIKKSQIKKLPFNYKATYKKGFFEGIITEQGIFLVKVDEDSEVEPNASDVVWAKWMTRDEVRKNLTFEEMNDIFEKSLEYL